MSKNQYLFWTINLYTIYKKVKNLTKVVSVHIQTL